MLNVLHIIPDLSKGGAERISLDICNELQKRENVLTKIIVFRDVNHYEFLSKDLDIEIIPSSVSISIKSPPQTDVSLLQSSVDSFRPDVLHLHLFESVFVNQLMDSFFYGLGKLRSKKFSNDELEQKEKRKWIYEALRKYLISILFKSEFSDERSFKLNCYQHMP